ncbi:uncharacterized protein LOC119584849 [Penaeus monodon]|uniref:uncharacterized protein LOC119584849 n=1 Tax=Penaeus monodon TaxID=6687 RepID=UPI0018A720B8|nr:uncharacterized protein LOC119584849 [Penaeus monodon]
MRPNVQQKPAVGVLLLWTLSYLAQSSGQELCNPFPFNQSLTLTPEAAASSIGISSFEDLQAMQEKLSACCWTAPNSCQVAGGFCIPAWLGRFCPQTNDALCGRCGCTCCMKTSTPAPCTGTCGSSLRRGVCRSSCNLLEESIPGKCSGDNCKCCARRIISRCNGFCSRPNYRCMPERECFMRKMDPDVGDLIPIDNCGSPGCACCPIFDLLAWING